MRGSYYHYYYYPTKLSSSSPFYHWQLTNQPITQWMKTFLTAGFKITNA